MDRKLPDDANIATITAYFEDLPDPRMQRSQLHPLTDIILLTLIAVLGGADNWVHIELFGKANEDWLNQFLELPNGIPSHDTLGRVFRMIDPLELGARLGDWLNALREQPDGGHIAVDGKVLRRTFEKAEGISPLHVVNAWAAESRLCIGTVALEEGDNEIVAIPKLLGLIDVKGQTVTIDAIGCQRSLAKEIIDGGGNYLLRVKDNQPTLADEMTRFFIDAESDSFEAQTWHSFEQTDGDHGRIEVRRTWTTSALDWFEDKHKWAGLETLVVQRCYRAVGEKESNTLRISISSCPAEDVERLARLARGHWAVENQLHWVLDMAFDEDRSRARKDNAPMNLAAIRRLALGLLKRNKSRKCGVAGRRLIAAWDRSYLIEVLTGA